MVRDVGIDLENYDHKLVQFSSPKSTYLATNGKFWLYWGCAHKLKEIVCFNFVNLGLDSIKSEQGQG